MPGFYETLSVPLHCSKPYRVVLMPPCASGHTIGTKSGGDVDTAADAVASVRIIRRGRFEGKYLVL